MTAAGAHWAMREHVTDTIWIKDKRLIPSLLIFYFHDFIFSAIAPIFNLNFLPAFWVCSTQERRTNTCAASMRQQCQLHLARSARQIPQLDSRPDRLHL